MRGHLSRNKQPLRLLGPNKQVECSAFFCSCPREIPRPQPKKNQARGERAVISEAAKVENGSHGSVEALSTATLHRSPPRGPPLGRFLRPGHWLSLTGAPVRWQGGRKARMDETLAQRFRSAVDALGHQKKSSVSVMPHSDFRGLRGSNDGKAGLLKRLRLSPLLLRLSPPLLRSKRHSFRFGQCGPRERSAHQRHRASWSNGKPARLS